LGKLGAVAVCLGLGFPAWIGNALYALGEPGGFSSEAGEAASGDFAAFMAGEWRGRGFIIRAPGSERERIACRLNAVSAPPGKLALAGRCASVRGAARFSMTYSRDSATAQAESPAMQETYAYNVLENGGRLLLGSQGPVPWGEGLHQSQVAVTPTGEDRVSFVETLTGEDGVERTALSVVYERSRGDN
jgi:hypothetical protein